MAKTKALVSFAVTAKLICAFVFALADCWFSHEVAQIMCFLVNLTFMVSRLETICVLVSKLDKNVIWW